MVRLHMSVEYQALLGCMHCFVRTAWCISCFSSHVEWHLLQQPWEEARMGYKPGQLAQKACLTCHHRDWSDALAPAYGQRGRGEKEAQDAITVRRHVQY